MSAPWNPNRQPVELRPSKIRRDPPPRAVDKLTALPTDDSQNETWAVVIGIFAFALAISVLIFSVSKYVNPANQPAPIVITQTD